MTAIIGLVGLLFWGSVLCVPVLLILLALPQCRLRWVGMCMLKWLAVAGLVLLTLSPVDFIPDVIPLGLADDAAYIVGAVMAARSALKDGRRAALPDQSQTEQP